jgi:hypothetical protein
MAPKERIASVQGSGTTMPGLISMLKFPDPTPLDKLFTVGAAYDAPLKVYSVLPIVSVGILRLAKLLSSPPISERVIEIEPVTLTEPVPGVEGCTPVVCTKLRVKLKGTTSPIKFGGIVVEAMSTSWMLIAFWKFSTGETGCPVSTNMLPAESNGIAPPLVVENVKSARLTLARVKVNAMSPRAVIRIIISGPFRACVIQMATPQVELIKTTACKARTTRHENLFNGERLKVVRKFTAGAAIKNHDAERNALPQWVTCPRVWNQFLS